jgi:hypothetical protein
LISPSDVSVSWIAGTLISKDSTMPLGHPQRQPCGQITPMAPGYGTVMRNSTLQAGELLLNALKHVPEQHLIGIVSGPHKG